MQKIADYFGVPVSYFYSDEEIPEYYFNEETAALAEELANKALVLLWDRSKLKELINKASTND